MKKLFLREYIPIKSHRLDKRSVQTKFSFKNEFEICIAYKQGHISKKIPLETRIIFISWITSLTKSGCIDDPIHFSGEYKRYSGN